jgi:hypothetical protein
VSEDSLLERVTPAAEERQLSQNTLTAYLRTWLKFFPHLASIQSSDRLPTVR